jgi:hypothetical protein
VSSDDDSRTPYLSKQLPHATSPTLLKNYQGSDARNGEGSSSRHLQTLQTSLSPIIIRSQDTLAEDRFPETKDGWGDDAFLRWDGEDVVSESEHFENGQMGITRMSDESDLDSDDLMNDVLLKDRKKQRESPPLSDPEQIPSPPSTPLALTRGHSNVLTTHVTSRQDPSISPVVQSEGTKDRRKKLLQKDPHIPLTDDNTVREILTKMIMDDKELYLRVLRYEVLSLP